MFTKIFSIACLICLFAIQASAQSPQVQPEEESPNSAEPQEPAKQEEDESQDLPVAEPVASRQQDEDVKKNDGQDTTQQISDSWVSLFGYWLTFADFLTAIFTTILLVITSSLAWYTYGLWREAAGQSALNRDALIKTQRAFVCVKRAFLFPNKDDAGNITGFALKVIWENNGATPTKGLISLVNRATCPGELPSDFGFPGEMKGKYRWSFIGPKATIESGVSNFTLDEIKSAWDGKTQIYYWGWAEYNDVFRKTKRHRFEFCYEIYFNGPSFPNNIGFSYVLHEKHNGEDDECLKPVQTSWPK